MDQMPTPNPYQNEFQGFQSQDNEVSLSDVVSFLEESWKQIVLAGVLGGMLGLGGWFFLGNYKAELLLQNNNGIDTISWRFTEKLLPGIAAEMLEKKGIPEDQVSLYRSLSNPNWWSKNVALNFALSKKEARELTAISEELDKAAFQIQSISVSTGARTEAMALSNAKIAIDFIRSAAAFIAITRLISEYEDKSIYQAVEARSRISLTDLELRYLSERAKALEQLQRRYPGAAIITHQVVDSKDEGAKYLPLTTQIIAVNADINAKKEKLNQLNDVLEQSRVYKEFLAAAAPVMVGRFDGIDMIRDYIGIEEQMRVKASQNNLSRIQTLDAINAEFLNIEVSFRYRLYQTVPALATKPGMVESGSAGFAVVGFSMLAFLLGRRVLSAVRTKKDK